MDPVDWLPIDENTLTELHERYKMLPSYLPPCNYLVRERQARLQSDRQEIRPGLEGMKEPKTNERIERMNAFQLSNKRRKRKERISRKRDKKATERAELMGLAQNKALADNYNTSEE